MSKLIIFDFDGTIADSMWAWDRLGRDTLDENNLPIPADYEDIIRTMSVPDFSVFLSKKYPVLGTAQEILGKWHKKMLYYYCNEIKLKAGIYDFLFLLKNRGYTLYLASATKFEVLLQALQHFNLQNSFDFILTEERVGVSKRDPEIYKFCIEKANTTTDKVVIFEDAEHAVKTVKALGIKTCAVKDYSMRKYDKEVARTADLYIQDFTDTKKLLKFIET